MEFRNGNQLKAYLKKESIRLGVSINNTYNTFFARNLLEGISDLNYGNFVVKGSFSQLIHSGKLYRPVTDIDLSSNKGISALNFLYEFLNEQNTFVTYQINRKPNVTSHGTHNFSVYCLFDGIKHSIGIDFMPDYKCIYEIQYKPVPTIFSKDKEFYINTPSYEEYLAEKLCIVAENNVIERIFRVKDFFDIYKLHNGQYDYEKFSIYFQKMLRERKRISIDEIDVKHLNKELIMRTYDLWDNVKRNYEFLGSSVEFEEAVYYTKGVLADQILKLRRNHG